MSTPTGYEKWGTKWADFALVVDTGEDIKCHKVLLAQSSPFFEAMLSTDCEETRSNKMKAKDFSLEAVTTFLEYLYAKAFDEKSDTFDETKITPELMRLCHMYDVKSLYELATCHLKESICDGNAVSLWFEAERIKNEELKSCVIEYIAHKKEYIVGHLAGIDEAYKCPELMKSLFASIAEKPITVTVSCSGGRDLKISVKPVDTIYELKKIVCSRVMSEKSEAFIQFWLPKYSVVFKGTLRLVIEDDRTLESYGIGNGSELFMMI